MYNKSLISVLVGTMVYMWRILYYRYNLIDVLADNIQQVYECNIYIIFSVQNEKKMIYFPSRLIGLGGGCGWMYFCDVYYGLDLFYMYYYVRKYLMLSIYIYPKILLLYKCYVFV